MSFAVKFNEIYIRLLFLCLIVAVRKLRELYKMETPPEYHNILILLTKSILTFLINYLLISFSSTLLH